MLYSQYPIDPKNMIFQVADPVNYPVNEFSQDGSKTPKTNKEGENQYEVSLMVTDQEHGRMSLEKVKVWAMESPTAHMTAGQLVELLNPCVYVGQTNNGQKFYGLKASMIQKVK